MSGEKTSEGQRLLVQGGPTMIWSLIKRLQGAEKDNRRGVEW